MFRPIPRYQVVVDAVLAGAAFLITAPLTAAPWGMRGSFGAWDLGEPLSMLLAVAVTAVLCVAFALRRVAPGLALAVAWVAALAQMAAGLPPLPGNVLIFGVLYTTAAYGTQLVFWLGFVSTLVGGAAITAYLLVPPFTANDGGFQGTTVSFVAAGSALFVAAALALMLSWTIGALVRTGVRARENRAAQERAEAAALAELERGRIARDMHDVVAHSLAVVIAQADGARYAAAADPSAATQALGTISSTARAALSDVRLLLTQLRHSQADGPQPTLADLDELYAHVRAAGVDLRVEAAPSPAGDVPASVQLAVYRILQEALTNALRHGDGGPVDLSLTWLDADGSERDRPEVRLGVRNGVRAGAVPNEGGHGLVGMGERASLVGGRLNVASVDGMFVVSATIPFDESGYRRAMGSDDGDER